MTVISFAHEVIFLKTRKTAGTSVELWLSSIAGPDDVLAPLDPLDEGIRSSMGGQAQNFWVPTHRYRPRDYARRLARRRPRFYNHMPASEVKARVGKHVWNSFLKVTIERDPYDRAVSMFNWKTQGSPAGDLLDFLHRFPTEKLANSSIYSINGEVVADVVLNYSTLADDVALFQRALGVPVEPLVKAKASGGTKVESGDVLGREGRRIVDQACAFDVGLTLPDKRVEALRL